MPQTGIEKEVRDRVESFVAELSDLIRRAALESVQEALGGGGSARAGAAGGSRKAPPRRVRAGRGGRRSEEDLAEAAAALQAYIKSNPGQRLEEIGVAMGESTKDLKRPVQMLISSGALQTEGQRRGTRYFPGTGKPARKKKATKKKAGKKTTGKKATRKKATRKKTSRKKAAA